MSTPCTAKPSTSRSAVALVLLVAALLVREHGRTLAARLGAALAVGVACPTVLTIALDAGFRSLGPFNRAFKAETGVTPSEYRQSALARAVS